MKPNPLKWPISCIAGILIILIWCISITISIALFPGMYNPINNTLSDLGYTSLNPEGAIFYNIGVILIGVLMFPFFIGFYKLHSGDSRNNIILIFIQLIGCFSALSEIMVGIFSENYINEHKIWAALFFLSILLVVILGAIFNFKNPNTSRLISFYGLVAVVINIFFVIIWSPLLEWITVITVLVYVGLIVYDLHKTLV